MFTFNFLLLILGVNPLSNVLDFVPKSSNRTLTKVLDRINFHLNPVCSKIFILIASRGSETLRSYYVQGSLFEFFICVYSEEDRISDPL